MTQHVPSYSRASRGGKPIAGRGGVNYNTTVRCSCGWRGQANMAPSKGGRALAEYIWEQHVQQEAATEGDTLT